MHQTRQSLRRVALALVLTVLAASCGDDDDQARTVEATTSSTTEAGTEPEESVEDATETTTTTTEPAPPSAMASVVVTLQDLPAGWTVSSQDDEDEDDDEEICDGQDPFNEVEPVEEAESNFEQGSFGPFVSSVAGRYSSTDEAQGVLDALADAVDQCQTFTETDEDGTETTYTFSALSFPKLGDDIFAARLSAVSPFGPIALDFAFARDGDAVAAIINGGLGAADTALTESMLRLMVERL